MAARDVAMIDIRCSRCDRHGRLCIAMPLKREGVDVAFWAAWRADQSSDRGIDGNLAKQRFEVMLDRSLVLPHQSKEPLCCWRQVMVAPHGGMQESWA